MSKALIPKARAKHAVANAAPAKAVTAKVATKVTAIKKSAKKAPAKKAAPKNTAKATRLSAKAAGKPRSNGAALGVHTDTLVKEGDFIMFAPTGEQLRVVKIEAGSITFEKTT